MITSTRPLCDVDTTFCTVELMLESSSVEVLELGPQRYTVSGVRVLDQSSWSWTLLEEGDALIFSAEILAQGPMSGQYYGIDIVMNAEEVRAYAERGLTALDELAEAMNRSTDVYLPRHRQDLGARISSACEQTTRRRRVAEPNGIPRLDRSDGSPRWRQRRALTWSQ